MRPDPVDGMRTQTVPWGVYDVDQELFIGSKELHG